MNYPAPDGGNYGTIASINLAEMQSLISGVTGAGHTLQAAASTLQSKGAGMGVSSPAFGKIKEIGSWAEEQLPALRRRLAMAQAMQQGKQTTVTFDETKISALSPADARKKATETANKLKDSLNKNGGGDNVLDPDAVADLKANMNDPYFAAQFAKDFPPDEVAGVLNRLNTQEAAQRQTPDPTVDDPDKARKAFMDNQKQLVSALSSTLSLASRGTGDLAPPDGYAQKFLDAIGAGGQTSIKAGAPASVSAILSKGQWSTKFVTDYNKGLIAFEKSDRYQQLNHPPANEYFKNLSHDSNGATVHVPGGDPVDWNPLDTGMQLLGKDPKASQAVLKDHDTLKFLAKDAEYNDNGDGFGKATESATTVYRNTGATGKTSALIASDLVNNLDADDLKDGRLKDMRDSMGRIFSSYIRDVGRIAVNHKSDALGIPGAINDPDSDFSDGELWGATFNRDQLKAIMGATETDDGAFKQISAHGLAYEASRLNYAMQHGGSADSDLFKAAVTHQAALMGLLMSTGGVANIKAGEDADARTEEWLNLAQGVAGMIPIPGGPAVEFVVGQGEDALVKMLETNHEGVAREKAQSGADVMESTLAQQTVQAIYRNNGVEKGGQYDPIAVPGGEGYKFANYKTEGGKTYVVLKDPSKLDADGRQAYQDWLSKSHSPYTKIRPDLVAIYNDEFPRNFDE